MSITLINPSGYPSAQDNLWSIAYSSNSGQTDFKYVFDVFVDNVQLVRTKVFPEPSNGRGYFDAMPVVSNEITYGWFNPANATNSEAVWLTKSDTLNEKIYQLRVGEDYSGTTYLNLASGNVTTYNYSAPLFKRRQINIGQKLNNWLTNRPLNINAKTTDKVLIPLFRSNTDSWEFELKKYGLSNNLIDTKTFYNPINYNIYNQLDFGVSAINRQILNDYVVSNYIDSNVKYYTIRALRSGDFTTPLLIINIDCNPLYTPVNLYFINAFGMFDTARFDLASRLTMDVELKTFEQRNYTFNNSTVDYYHSQNVYNESKINYGSKTSHSYKLTMNYPTDAEYQWLAELIVSPQIYAEIDGNYYPVTIKTNNYEYSTYTNNRLKALEIEIELNQTRYNFKR
jgi:hypothetical protein